MGRKKQVGWVTGRLFGRNVSAHGYVKHIDRATPAISRDGEFYTPLPGTALGWKVVLDEGSLPPDASEVSASELFGLLRTLEEAQEVALEKTRAALWKLEPTRLFFVEQPMRKAIKEHVYSTAFHEGDWGDGSLETVEEILTKRGYR